jgi:hypothetical protein
VFRPHESEHASEMKNGLVFTPVIFLKRFCSNCFLVRDKLPQSCGISSSDSGGYEEFYLLGVRLVVRLKSADVSEKHISTCLPLPLLAACFILVSCSAYSSTLKMQATCSSETSGDLQRNTRGYIAEDRNFPHSCVI